LWHARYYGLQFLKPQFEFHVLVTDTHNFVEQKATSELYPPEGLVDKPSVIFEDTTVARRIMVLNPLKGRHNRVAMVLPTKLSQNIALIVGFRTLQSGLPDVRQPWNITVPISKDHLPKDIWSDVEEPPPSKSTEVSKIMIDGVSVSVEISQQSWWAKSSRNILIYFSPVRDKQLEETSLKVVPWLKILDDDAQNAQRYSAIDYLWGHVAEENIDSPMRFTKLLLDPTEDVADVDRGMVALKKLLSPDKISSSSSPSIVVGYDYGQSKSVEMEEVD